MTTPDENPETISAEQPSRHDIEEILEQVRDAFGYSEDHLGSDGNPPARKDSEEDTQPSPQPAVEIFTSSTETTINTLRASTSFDAPLTVAIDVTEFDAGYWSEHVDPTAEDYDGRKEPASRQTKLAVISTVSTPVPVVLGIEPLEKPGVHDQSGRPRLADVVQSLLDQATQHVEIDTVLADRGFHSAGVFAEIERHDLTYIIPARPHSIVRAVINRVKDHGSPDYAVERDVTVQVVDQTYTTNFVLVRRKSAAEGYVVFLTNTEPSDGVLEETPNRYTQRWQIQNQSKTLRTRLESKSLPDGVQCQDCLAAAADVNAYSLANHLLTERSNQPTDQYVLKFDEFLQALYSQRYPFVTKLSSAAATEESRVGSHEHEDIVERLADQAANLCQEHSDLVAVIAHLDVQPDWFSAEWPTNAAYELPPIVLLHLYQHARKLSQTGLLNHLDDEKRCHARSGLQQLPSQSTLSRSWRTRFSPTDRLLIETAADRIRRVFAEHHGRR